MAAIRICLSIALATALAACHTAARPGMTPTAASTTKPPAAASSLTAYHWDLVSARDRGGQAIGVLRPKTGKPLRLDFDGGRLSISGGCNRISGSYEHRGDALRVGPLMQTEMACADRRLMELDAAIAMRLQGALQVRVTTGTPQMELVTPHGDLLVFTGVPTPQTRYGGEGRTLFFEVAAQRQPCSHPLIPNMQCLQVRERRYVDSGLMLEQGEWQLLYQDIEGYTHTPGQRDVVRVKRFVVKNPPADAPSVVYVLDLVVESERVPLP